MKWFFSGASEPVVHLGGRSSHVRVIGRHSSGIALLAVLTSTVAALGPLPAPAVTETLADLTQPHVLAGNVAGGHRPRPWQFDVLWHADHRHEVRDHGCPLRP